MGKAARLHGVPDGLDPGVSRTRGTARTRSAQAGLCHTAKLSAVCQGSLRPCVCSSNNEISPPRPSEQAPVTCTPRALLPSLAEIPVYF